MSVVPLGHPIAVIVLLSSQIGASPVVAIVDLDASGIDPAFTYQHGKWIRTSGSESSVMPHYRIAQAASLLGVSDDSVRRWIDSGQLSASSGSGPTHDRWSRACRWRQQPNPARTWRAGRGLSDVWAAVKASDIEVYSSD